MQPGMPRQGRGGHPLCGCDLFDKL